MPGVAAPGSALPGALWPSSGPRRSICLYTPSVAPSGMGVHMLDLAAEYVGQADVSVMCWATAAGQEVLQEAADLGAAVVPLPPPRDPSFAETIAGFLEEHPPTSFTST